MSAIHAGHIGVHNSPFQDHFASPQFLMPNNNSHKGHQSHQDHSHRNPPNDNHAIHFYSRIPLPPQLQGYVRYVVVLDPQDNKPYSIGIKYVCRSKGADDVLARLSENVNRRHKKRVHAWLCKCCPSGTLCELDWLCPNIHVTPLGYVNRRLWTQALGPNPRKDGSFDNSDEWSDDEEEEEFSQSSSRHDLTSPLADGPTKSFEANSQFQTITGKTFGTQADYVSPGIPLSPLSPFPPSYFPLPFPTPYLPQDPVALTNNIVSIMNGLNVISLLHQMSSSVTDPNQLNVINHVASQIVSQSLSVPANGTQPSENIPPFPALQQTSMMDMFSNLQANISTHTFPTSSSTPLKFVSTSSTSWDAVSQ